MPEKYISSPGPRPPVTPLPGHPLRLVQSLLAKVAEADDELARAPNAPPEVLAEIRESLAAHSAALRIAVHRLETLIVADGYQAMGRSDRMPP